jgi:hypothetical protein
MTRKSKLFGFAAALTCVGMLLGWAGVNLSAAPLICRDDCWCGSWLTDGGDPGGGGMNALCFTYSQAICRAKWAVKCGNDCEAEPGIPDEINVMEFELLPGGSCPGCSNFPPGSWQEPSGNAGDFQAVGLIWQGKCSPPGS